MSEQDHGHRIFSLLEVTQSIQRTISQRYKTSFWVKAEMNKLNFYKQSGHCYPDLVEKHEAKIVAQFRAHLWKADFARINAKFNHILKEPLKDGIKILFLARVSFDPSHGLALWIQDIDPAYTLGDLEREKQETISRLREEDLFDRNKNLKLALLPKRIAIISVESSKGYADFEKILSTNSQGYTFLRQLFPALLQGDGAISSIIAQLGKIRRAAEYFDVVAIIRGGGGEVGLSCYNNYTLAKTIAEFPLPVITGIGHATNETVTEMIAFANAITPTKLAETLLQKFRDFERPVEDAERKIKDRAGRIIESERARFNAVIRLLDSAGKNLFLQHYGALNAHERSIAGGVKLLLKEASMKVFTAEQNIRNMSPENVLKRGYSITKLNGRTITAVYSVKTNDRLETLVYNGRIISTVNESIKNHE